MLETFITGFYVPQIMIAIGAIMLLFPLYYFYQFLKIRRQCTAKKDVKVVEIEDEVIKGWHRYRPVFEYELYGKTYRTSLGLPLSKRKKKFKVDKMVTIEYPPNKPEYARCKHHMTENSRRKLKTFIIGFIILAVGIFLLLSL
ncbi:MAG: hypothetical protein MJ245_04805 [Clostridia bacterium]|nr:hypothetical protein [Clostridia bacterium]